MQKKRTFREIAVNLLPVFLFVFPILALNLGWNFIARIEFFWQEKNVQETARQELESLTAGSEFEYQLARHAGRLLNQLEASASIPGEERRKEFVAGRARKIFVPPFPDSTVYAFVRPKAAKDFQINFSNAKKIVSRRAIAMIFERLVAENKGVESSAVLKKQREKLLKNFMGQGTSAEVMATSMRGRTTFILHEHYPHYFIWDYRDIEGFGSVGYFVLTRAYGDTAAGAMKIAVRESVRRSSGLAGFVPIIDGTGEAILAEPLKRSEIFQNWVRNSVPDLEKNFHYWIENGPPENFALGKYRAYSYLGKGKSHLSVFLLPGASMSAYPGWIKLINLLVWPFVLLLVIRGLLLEKWIRMNLTWRFVLLYILSASLPLSLLAISSSGYFYQFSFSREDSVDSSLKACLNQFDARKSQIQDAYRVAAAEVFKDRKLANLISVYGLDSKEVERQVLSFFKNRSDPLPLLGFYILGLDGKGLSYYEETSSTRLDKAFEVFKIPLIKTLRNKFTKANPHFALPEFVVSEEQRFGELAYRSVSGNDLDNEMERRRSTPIQIKIGTHTATQMHDFIKIDGVESVLIYIVWDDRSLDPVTLRATSDFLGLSHKQFAFAALKNSTSGLEPVIQPGRHIDSEFLSLSESLAEAAMARGGPVSRSTSRYYLLAKPARKYFDTILIGGFDRYYLQFELQKRFAVLVAIVVFSLLVVLICVWGTTEMLVRPVREMRSALEQVSTGNLKLKLVSNRPDEIGELAESFSTMVQGIRERKELAALLSDQAIEAISGDHLVPGKTLSARSFTAVAMVSDIRGFTTLCESCPAEEITEMLNDHFAAMAAIISNNGGRIYKFIGDAIEAVFTENDTGAAAENALAAAISMCCALKFLNKNRARSQKFTYSFGVGLAMGNLVSGQIGSDASRIDYAVIGDPLSRAAEFEGFSKECAGLPIVVDAEIAGLLQNRLKFLPVNGNESGFEPSTDSLFYREIEEKFIFSARDSKENLKDDGESDKMSDSVHAGKIGRRSRLVYFVLFCVFLVITVAGIFGGILFHNSAQRERDAEKTYEGFYGLVEQLKSESAPKVAFEMHMREMIKECEEQLAWQPKANDKEIIKKSMQAAMTSLEQSGAKSSRFAAFYFNPDKTLEGPWQMVEPVLVSSMGKDHEQWLTELAAYKFGNYLKYLNSGFKLNFDDKAEKLFGNKNFADLLCSEKFGSASLVRNQETQEYFYWNFVTVFDPQIYQQKLHDATIALKRSYFGQFRVVGLVMVSIPADLIRSSAKFMVQGYENSQFEFALIGENGDFSATRNFPSLGSDFSYNSALPEIPEIWLTEDVFRSGSERFRIIYAARFAGTQIDEKLSLVVLLCLATAAILFFFLSVFKETFITRSLRLQLALSLALIVFIPVITVIFVLRIFLAEQEQTMIGQKKVEMRRLLDSLELRQYYFKPLVIKMLRDWSNSARTGKLYRQLQLNPDSQKSYNDFQKFWQDIFDSYEIPYDYASNFYPRELYLISKDGWAKTFFNGSENKKSDIGPVLTEFAHNLLDQLLVSSETETKSFSPQKAKREMYFDSGLTTIRSSFGEDGSARLGNFIGDLVELEVVTGAAAIMALPVPTIEKPQFMILWITMLTSGSYLSRIAENSLDKTAIFSIENHRYGLISHPRRRLGDLGLERICAWLAASNLPVSEERFFGQQKILIEGRPGVAQFNNFLIAISSKSVIEEQILALGTWFVRFLLIFLLVIFAVAYLTAQDIIFPIRNLIYGMKEIDRQNFFFRIDSGREDELGELCNSYNQLAQGLAEKAVMGKMLSQSAISQVAGQSKGRQAEKSQHAILLVGIPGFASWLGSGAVTDLFADLQKQSAEICRIISEEGGEIDKFIGDKLLAIFYAKSGKCAVESALKAIRSVIRAEEKGLLPFPAALGLNYGQVISGFLGVGAKRDFTIIGDAVNVAARIEKEAEKLRYRRALISESCFDLLEEKSELRLYCEIQLKGKSQILKIFSFV